MEQLLPKLSTVKGRRLSVFMSAKAIDIGDNWLEKIDANIGSCDLAVICLTRENQLSPWIHFEAGAIGRSVSAKRILPFLIGISASDIVGPLRSIQSASAGVDGVGGLIKRISRLWFGTDDAFAKKTNDAAIADAQMEIERIAGEQVEGTDIGSAGSELEFWRRRAEKETVFRAWLAKQIHVRASEAIRQLGARVRSFLGEGDVMRFIRRELDRAPVDTDVMALCGEKSWDSPLVANYFAANFDYARRLYVAEGRRERPRLRRIFAVGNSDAVEDRRLIIKRHNSKKNRRRGVEARTLSAAAMSFLKNTLDGPTSARTSSNHLASIEKRLESGFGFVVIRDRSTKMMLVHVNRGEQVRASLIVESYVVSEVIRLFDDLWNCCEPSP